MKYFYNYLYKNLRLIHCGIFYEERKLIGNWQVKTQNYSMLYISTLFLFNFFQISEYNILLFQMMWHDMCIGLSNMESSHIHITS